MHKVLSPDSGHYLMLVQDMKLIKMKSCTINKLSLTSLVIYIIFVIGKRVHGMNWIVMWDKIEGTKYETGRNFKHSA